jgi:hypothetical protein
MLLCVGDPSDAFAQSVALLTVTGQRTTASYAAEDLARIASIAGSDVIVGPALSAALESQYALRDYGTDTLRDVRERIARSRRAYEDAVAINQREPAESALRALEQDAAALIAQPMALDRSRENREALMSALLFVANVTVQDQPTRAQEAVRKLVEALPDLVLSARVAREAIRTMYREHARQVATASLVVQSIPDGCQVRRNGVMLGNAPAQLQGLVPGQHRISLRCGGRNSLVHLVNVGAGTTSTVQIDLAIDRALEFGQAPTLRYDDVRTRDGRSIADASVLGSALGVERVLMYRPEDRRVAIIDVLTRTIVRELDQREWSQLPNALHGRGQHAEQTTSASPTSSTIGRATPEVRVSVRTSRAPSTTPSRSASRAAPSGSQMLLGVVFSTAGLLLAGSAMGAWIGADIAQREAGLFGRDGQWLGASQPSIASIEMPLRTLAIGGWIAGGGLFAAGLTLTALGVTRREATTNVRALLTPNGMLVQGVF